MKAAAIQVPGPADHLQLQSIDRPVPKDTQVLVRVAVSAVNPIDTYIRSGAVAMDLPSPWIPGCDFAGTIEECGPQVRSFQVGQRVWGSNQGLFGCQGTLAEYVAVDEQWLYACPDNVPFETCAATALTGITAHLGLFQHAGLKSGETVFVNGGTGGVGSMVVQLARAAGARVITTAGTAEKCELASQLGADVTINYREQSVFEALSQVSEGIEVWFETLRNPDPAATIPLMRHRGRYVVMAGREAAPAFPIGPFYVRDLRMIGFAMFNASSSEQKRCAEDLNQSLASGKIRPVIGATYALSESAAAHQHQENATLQSSGSLQGKILVQIDGGNSS